MISNSRRKAPNKRILFPQTENKFPVAGMTDLLKNMFSLDVKVTFCGSNALKKIGENGFH